MTMTLDGTAGMTAPQGAVYNGLQTGTAQASTSGTSIDFTSIPVWAKRITVMFNGVSTNGTSVIQIQLGSGSFTTSGYSVVGSTIVSGSVGAASYTSGFGLGDTNAATRTKNGSVVFSLVTGNTWAGNGACANTSDIRTDFTQGVIALSGVLDRVRITTVNGTDTFDAGSINIMYE